MAHVDEKIGHIAGYGFVPDPEFVHEFTPGGSHPARDDM